MSGFVPVTRCPFCETTFRVTETQLNAARGAVRCGACLQVFLAPDHFVLEEGMKPDSLTATSATDPSYEDENTAEDKTSNEFTSAESTPDESTPDESTPDESTSDESTPDESTSDESTAAKIGPVYHTEWADDTSIPAGLDEVQSYSISDDEANPDTIEQPPGDTVIVSEWVPAAVCGEVPTTVPEEVPQAVSEAVDNGIDAGMDETAETSMIFGTPDQPGPAFSTEDQTGVASTDDGRIDEVAATAEKAQYSTTGDTSAGEALLSTAATFYDGTKREHSDEGPAHPFPAHSYSAHPYDEVLPEDVRLDFELPAPILVLDESPARPAQWQWWVGSAVLALTLGLQYAWFNMSTLANEPVMRPYVQTTCRVVGCDVPEFSDPGALRATDLVIRSHPNDSRSLLVDAVIENKAPFRQAFPMLELKFASLNQKLIAARAFRPVEYLGGEMSGLKYIPGRTEVRISLEIVDPGPRAASYELSVL